PLRRHACVPAEPRQADSTRGRAVDQQARALHVGRRRGPAAIDRRVLRDLRAPPDLPHARHQLHQLSRRDVAGVQARPGDPLLLGAQPVRPRRWRARAGRAGHAAARGDTARARSGDRRPVRHRHAGRRDVRRILQPLRDQAVARTRWPRTRGGRRHRRRAADRGVLPAVDALRLNGSRRRMAGPPRRTPAWVGPNDRLPDPSRAWPDPNGLLAAGADLSAARLLEAYRQGIFPWYTEGQPVLWWSPDPRMVLYLDEFKASRSLAKKVRSMRRDGR